MVDAMQQCPFCGETLVPEIKPVIAACRHAFCGECISGRLEHGRNACPCCRRDIDKSQLIELPESWTEQPLNSQAKRQSAKTAALLQVLERALEDRKSKVVIFSQWTSFLDIIGDHLVKRGLQYTRIDGTMKTADRDEAIRSLTDSQPVRVMLASLKVAGVGISLVAADTVILADSCKFEP
jgi:SWI/SNF-related matrix-associated actin-dependent regulator of chromatin subfamily A3